MIWGLVYQILIQVPVKTSFFLFFLFFHFSDIDQMPWWHPFPVKKTKKDAKKRSLKVVEEEKGYREIILCEPMTLKKDNLLKYKNVPMNVTPELYKELKKAPKRISNFIDVHEPEEMRNAYIFGKKRIPTTHYEDWMSHGNDASQTGLLDITEWRKNPTDFSNTKEAKKWWSKIFKPYKWQWDNREALKKVRTVHPSILFLGDTLGDGGATLFYHRNTKDQIDSIAIVF